MRDICIEDFNGYTTPSHFPVAFWCDLTSNFQKAATRGITIRYWIRRHRCIRESYRGQDGKSRAEWMRDQADRCCEIYTARCNGDIYQYTIEDEDGDVVESLCGTYDLDHCTAEAKSAAKRLLADRESEARKIAAMMHE